MPLALKISIVLALSAAARAQTATPHNAAVWYQRAIERVNAFREGSPQDWELILNFDPALPPTAELRAALSRAQPILDLARRAASEPHCTFDLDRSAGVEMLLPHLSPMRSISRMLAYDAYVRVQDGDAAGAAANLADLYRMSGHFDDDRTVISSLVGQAVFSLAEGTAQYGIDRGVFGAEQSQTILQGLERLNAVDPFEYAGAVAGEQEIFGGWLAQRFADGEEPARIMADLMSMTGSGNSPELFAFISPEQFQREITIYNDVMDRMVNAFKMPDRAAALQEIAAIEDEIEQTQQQSMLCGDGVLAGLLLPALGKAMVNRNKAEAMLATRRGLLGSIAAGASNPEQLANAAIWYLRGVEMLEKLEPATLGAIRTFAADTSAPMSDELSAALIAKPVRDVIEIFHDGSNKGRCDFSFTRPTNRQPQVTLIPAYLPGLHDAIRLLHADAVRLLRGGSEESRMHAIDRLAVCFRITAHLADDPIILSALVSHCDFKKTLGLAQTALENQMLDAAAKPALLAAVERMKTKDPFGFIDAVVATREELGKYLGGFAGRIAGAGGDAHPDEIKKAQDNVREVVKSLSGDQLLYVLAVYETTQQNATAEAIARVAATNPAVAADADAAPRPDDVLERLSDVISRPDLEAVHREIPHIAPMLSRQDFEFLKERTIPAIASSADGKSGANFADHLRRAHGDLRRAHQLLRAESNSDASR